MPTLLIIGAGEFQTPIIKKCSELGYRVIATDGNAEAEGLKYADIGLCIDTLDKNKTFEAAAHYHVDGIITTSDYPVRTVAYVCEKLNLPGPSIKAAEIATNKFLLRECLKKHNIPVPYYQLVKNKEEVLRNKANYPYPVIVKPVDSSASRGVMKANTAEHLAVAFEEAHRYSKSGQVIIEEYMEGPEFSVEILIQNQKSHLVAITEKTTSGAPYFVEERHVIPAALNEFDQKQVGIMITETIQAIGLNNSAAHIEFRLTSEGPRIIEVGPRLGGDYITSDLVPLSTGIDMLSNIIRIALGHKIDLSRPISRSSCVQFIIPRNYDSAVKNYYHLSQSKYLVRCQLEKIPSEGEFKNSLDRLGYFIYAADNFQQIEDLLSILEV